MLQELARLMQDRGTGTVTLETAATVPAVATGHQKPSLSRWENVAGSTTIGAP
jgi:hypothetical protein